MTTLPAGTTYQVVIGIQVFQHGDRRAAHEHIRSAQARIRPGGLFCMRVNAIGTDLAYAHDVVERDGAGGTMGCRERPKNGLDIHFFAADELDALFAGYAIVLTPRLVGTCARRARAGSGRNGNRSGERQAIVDR